MRNGKGGGGGADLRPLAVQWRRRSRRREFIYDGAAGCAARGRRKEVGKRARGAVEPDESRGRLRGAV